MDTDAIRREIALLEREIVVIKQELGEARRESVRVALRQELEEKEAQQANLSSQINVDIGNSNSLSSENMIIGANVGGDLNQYNQNSGINASNSIFGDGAIVAENIYIYPSGRTQKDLTPIDVYIFYEANLSRKISRESEPQGKWIFSVERDIWDDKAPFQVIVRVTDRVTQEYKQFVLYSGELILKDTSFSAEILNIEGGKSKYMLIRSDSYFCSDSDRTIISRNIIDTLSKLSEDGYDVDDDIIRFSDEDCSNLYIAINVYQEKYRVMKKIGKRENPKDFDEIREKDGIHTGIIYTKIVRRRNRL
jgi:hypothetical protein